MKKIYQKMMVLLDARQKKQMVLIVLMMLLGGMLETLGIAMLLPAMTTVVDPDAVSKSEKLSAVYNILGCTSIKQFAIIIFVALIGIFVIKNIVLFGVLIYELAGPVITKAALEKAGEITRKPEGKTARKNPPQSV